MKSLQKYIYTQVAKQSLSKEDAKVMLQELQKSEINEKQEYAVIGMSGKMPGADNLEQYWNNLRTGTCSIDEFPVNRWEDTSLDVNVKASYRKGGYLKEVDKFDCQFFNISPQEAKYMSPLQRLLLQTSYEAVEDAGYGGKQIYGSNTGVYVGVETTSIPDYNQLFPQSDSLMFTGSMAGILASRVSYQLNLKGPSLVIDTACSSSLTALITACQAMENNLCDLAIVSGICLNLLPALKENVMNIVESRDDLVKAFDQSAGGTSWGEAVGAVVVKPLIKALKDGDAIYGTVRGWAMNNDGASNGITAPDAKAQEDVITKAWKNAKINPETIQYIETHGTGTKLGDPIEIRGITNAFRRFTDKKQFCGIGSVKTNIGHSVGASGMCSLIKVMLMLKYKQLVPSLHFHQPNGFIHFIDSPVYVNDTVVEWKNEFNTRRAGISAFGFSGTNCHVIIEEAPQVKQNQQGAQSDVHIFTISAKSKENLHTYIQKYYQFLLNNRAFDVSDICYTANIGRGHYNHRTIITCTSLVQLIRKLGHIVSKELDNIEESGIYYGEHQVVSNQSVVQGNEITEEQKTQLTEDANTLCMEYLKVHDVELLTSICKKYIEGADVNLDVLYEDRKHLKVHLPTYPFQSIRCWPDKIENKKPETELKIIAHPFLDYCIADAINSTIYKTMFSVSKLWILSEHKVNNRYTLPGISYIELAGVLARQHFHCNAWKVKDLMFLYPLVVDLEMDKEVQTVIHKKDSCFEFTIASKKNNEWIKHAEGKLEPLSGHQPTYQNLQELEQICHTKMVTQYTYDETGSIDVGPRWNVVQSTEYGEREVLAYLQLPDAYQQDLNEFYLHPTLLDCAMNAAIHLIGDGLYLPWGYKEIKVYEKLPKECYSYLRRTDQGSNQAKAATFDVCVFDKAGKVLIEVTGYTIKKVKESEGKDDCFYQVGWIKQELEQSPENPEKKKQGSILVFKGIDEKSDRITKGIRYQGKRVIEVVIGDAYEKIDENTYKVASDEASYTKLMKNFKEENLSCILHLLNLELHKVDTIQQFEECKSLGVMSLFYLTRAILLNRISQVFDIVLLANQVNEITLKENSLNPQAAALFGLSKVVTQEYSKLQCRCIDIDQNTEIMEILHEVESGRGFSLVAYRNGERYVQEMQQLDVENTPKRNLTIQEKGTYIITGGLGGIGLEFARYIASKNRVNLILLNRSQFPERTSWSEILENNQDRKLIHKIQAIQAIEMTGSKVTCYSVDVSDERVLHNVFEELHQKYGRINGVIHSAGVAGKGLLISKEEKIFQGVLQPKMNGTWLLDQFTSQDNLDFFVLFSSIASILGGVGQGDYTAGNMYLDAYAAYRNKKGKPTLSVNWTAWKEIGMAVDFGFNVDGVFKEISTEKALQCFEQVWGAMVNHIIIGSVDENLYEALPIRTSWADTGQNRETHIHMEIEKPMIKELTAGIDEQKNSNVKLMGKANGEYSRVEQQIANMWGAILGMSVINVYDNFDKIGGNSILAIKLLDEIQTIYPNMVEIADIFTYSTIHKFASVLTERKEVQEKNNIIEDDNTIQDEDEKLMDILNKLKTGSISLEESIKSLE